MSFDIDNVIETLNKYGITPLSNNTQVAPENDGENPETGHIGDGEQIYSTSLEDIFNSDQYDSPDESPNPFDEDPRIKDWKEDIRRALSGDPDVKSKYPATSAPEPHCAWYAPIHFFGHAWGIYIREECVLEAAIHIASFVNASRVQVSPRALHQQLLRSAFYTFFLHEQFHHKVESLGFRLLVATGTDKYIRYKNNVYRKHFGKATCLEESLANAESIRRFSELRYQKKVDPEIRRSTCQHLEHSIPNQGPGYAQGLDYVSDTRYRLGLGNLQSLVLDGQFPSVTPSSNWRIAPKVITALTDITKEIYVVLPRGAKPLFPVRGVDPAGTVTSQEVISSLTRNYGYTETSGGKGSHVKLSKTGRPTVIVPGGRAVVSPGVVKHVLKAIGGYPLSRARDFVAGTLPDRSSN